MLEPEPSANFEEAALLVWDNFVAVMHRLPRRGRLAPSLSVLHRNAGTTAFGVMFGVSLRFSITIDTTPDGIRVRVLRQATQGLDALVGQTEGDVVDAASVSRLVAGVETEIQLAWLNTPTPFTFSTES